MSAEWARLRQDRTLWIATSVLLVAMVPYALPWLTADQFYAWRYRYADIPVALAALIAASVGVRHLGSSAERHFWRLLALAYGATVVVELANAFLPDAALTPLVRLLLQSGFLVFVGALMLAAAASRGGTTDQSVWNLHRLRSVGLGALGVGFLIYFNAVPDEAGSGTGEVQYAGLFMYAALDIAVALMFLRALQCHVDTRWRGILLGLATLSGMYAVLDGWEGVLALEPFRGTEIAPLWDFAWFVPVLFFIVVARRYLAEPSAAGAEPRIKTPPRPDRGLMVFGLFGFPLGHAVLHYFGLVDPALRQTREGVVALFVLVMGAITLVYFRLLERARSTSVKELELSEERYRSFVQARSDGIYRAEAEPPISTSSDTDDQIAEIEARVRISEVNEVGHLPPGVRSAEVGGTLVELFPRDSLWREGLRRWVDAGYEIELEVVHEDEAGERWYFRYGLTGIVEDGNLHRIWLTRSNVTPKRRADEEAARLSRQLERSRKLESLGALAGGLAHDFNNLLTPIMGHTELARDAISRNEDGAADSLQHVLTASKRAANLAEQILLVSRDRPRRQVPVRMQETVSAVSRLVRSGLPRTIELEVTADDECPPVLGDASRLHQVVMNLCTNAADAIGSRPGRIQIRLRQEAGETNHDPTLRGWVVLEVEDDGPGVEGALQERVFEPFFTTKQPGEGPGLGLSVVHGIATSHHGRVDFESEPGLGTTVTVRFPATGLAELGAPSVSRLRSHLSILVVDDDPAVAGVTKSVLEAYGHSVTAVTDPYLALKDLRGRPGHYDVVVTDYSMPGLTGLDLVDAVREVAPRTGIVLSSGYNLADQERGDGVVHLAKPFTAAQLAHTVSRAKVLASA